MPTPPHAHAARSAPPAADGTRIRVGIGGWTYAPWRDNFYPHALVQRRELEYASRHVTAIEVNGTYYGAQKPATYAKWGAETPDGFVLSLKAPRYTTDRRTLADAGKPVADFVHGGVAELGDRLGPINWQFPPHKPFERDDFAAFLALLPRELDGRALRHVVEVRHPSFMAIEYIELARRYCVATVFTDSPKHPSFADVTGDFVYARLQTGADDIPTCYSDKALDEWAARAKLWAEGKTPDDLPLADPANHAEAKPRDVFVYFITSGKVRAPHGAMAFMERVA